MLIDGINEGDNNALMVFCVVPFAIFAFDIT